MMTHHIIDMFRRRGHANRNGIILGSGQQGRNHDLVAHLIGDRLFCGVLGPIKPPLHTRTDETISATSDNPFGDDGKEFSVGGVGFEDEGASGCDLDSRCLCNATSNTQRRRRRRFDIDIHANVNCVLVDVILVVI